MPIRSGRHRIDYADPGYLADRAPRYALDTTGRIRDAMGRFTQNAWRYTREQQRTIRARILAAGRRAGIHFAAAGAARRRGLYREPSRAARRAGRR